MVYEPLKEGGYQVIVPLLPGLVTYGRNFEEAREMAQDAIRCYVEGLMKDRELPQQIPRVITTQELLISQLAEDLPGLQGR